MTNLKIEIADYLNEYHGGRDTDLDAIEAAEHIVSKLAEPHLREMIAAEIEVEHLRVKSHNDDGSLDGECAGLHIALTIAKGPQQ